MSEKISRKENKPEELIRTEKLIDDGKFDEALQLMKDFEETGDRPLHDIVLSHLIRCDLLLQQGLNNDSVKLAEHTYKESLGLGKNLLSVDALIFMAESLIRLSKYDEAFDVNKQGEELLNSFTKKLTSEYKRREASIVYIQGKISFYKSEGAQALKHFEHSLVLREVYSPKKEIAVSLSSIAWIILNLKGELDGALKYAERGLAIAKESNNKYEIGFGFLTNALIYSFMGELDRSIIQYEKSFAIFKELNNKRMMAIVLNDIVLAYRNLGDLDRALECLELSLAIRTEGGTLRDVAEIHDYLIQILIEKGDLERAQQLLHDMEQLNNQLKDKQVNLWFLFDKALLLKTNPRARNRVKAEEIFKLILEDEDSYYEITVWALLNLCDLLLIELRTINEIEVLGEIESYITQLLDIVEKSQSYWILCETYLLQAKLSLLTFNIKKAQRFLTQAQQIAERFGVTQLTTRIANEKENLRKQLDLWEKLKKVDAPMVDRFELARLDEQIAGMVKNRTVLTSQVTEEKIVVSKEKKICLVCRGEVIRFFYICECGSIYCGNCALALTNLENKCWACEVPIDYSKPVKSFDKEEAERIKVQEKTKKKKRIFKL